MNDDQQNDVCLSDECRLNPHQTDLTDMVEWSKQRADVLPSDLIDIFPPL